MVTDRKLIDYLPPFLQEHRELDAIMETEQPEIDNLWNSAQQTLSDQFVSEATESGVKRWESMLGTSPKGTDTLDERKFRVLSKLNQELPYTLRKLEQVLTTLCGSDGYSIELNAAEYNIEIKLGLANHNNYGEVERILKAMIPANLTQVITLLFNRWEDVKNEHQTWSDVLFRHETWNNVLYKKYVVSRLDVDTLENFILDKE